MKIFIITLTAVILVFNGSFNISCGSNTSQTEKSDTTFISYPNDLKFFIPQKYNYSQVLTMKLMLSQALYEGKLKRRDNGQSKVAFRF